MQRFTVKRFNCISMKSLINLCWYVSRTWNKIVKLLEIMLPKVENIRLTFYECSISDWNLWENVKGLRIHFYLLPWSYPTSSSIIFRFLSVVYSQCSTTHLIASNNWTSYLCITIEYIEYRNMFHGIILYDVINSSKTIIRWGNLYTSGTKTNV